MNTARILLVGLLLALSLTPPTLAATAREISRQEIRQMPITQRPSRPGHFYGNTVRRAHARRGVKEQAGPTGPALSTP